MQNVPTQNKLSTNITNSQLMVPIYSKTSGTPLAPYFITILHKKYVCVLVIIITELL